MKTLLQLRPSSYPKLQYVTRHPLQTHPVPIGQLSQHIDVWKTPLWIPV